MDARQGGPVLKEDGDLLAGLGVLGGALGHVAEEDGLDEELEVGLLARLGPEEGGRLAEPLARGVGELLAHDGVEAARRRLVVLHGARRDALHEPEGVLEADGPVHGAGEVLDHGARGLLEGGGGGGLGPGLGGGFLDDGLHGCCCCCGGYACVCARGVVSGGVEGAVGCFASSSSEVTGRLAATDADQGRFGDWPW